MKNDNQIAFIELSFQNVSGKFVTIFRYTNPLFLLTLYISLHLYN